MNDLPRQGPDALAALMAYVSGVRDQRLAALQAAARDECAALLAAARSRARGQIRQALGEVRADADTQVAVARAAVQSRLRRARQALTLKALDGVHERVAAALRARWAAPPSRRQWILMALAEATHSLPPGRWEVSLPPAAGPLPATTVPDGVELASRADPSIEAGVHIRCAAAALDATLAGLLRERERIAALWLGELERRRDAGSSP